MKVNRNSINIMNNHQWINKAKELKVNKMIKKIHFTHCKKEFQLIVQLTNQFRK